MAKTAINKKTFHREIVLRFKEEASEVLHLERITFCDAENWTLREVYQKYLESFELWCWRSREKISCTVGVKNEEEILHGVKEECDILHTMKRRKAI
jgi:hypothetical protein